MFLRYTHQTNGIGKKNKMYKRKTNHSDQFGFVEVKKARFFCIVFEQPQNLIFSFRQLFVIYDITFLI